MPARHTLESANSTLILRYTAHPAKYKPSYKREEKIMLKASNTLKSFIEKLRKRLEKIFYPSNPSGNPKDAAKVLISTSKDFFGECRELMELRLYAVEYDIDFSHIYGDIDAAYYRSIMRYFDRCCKFIDKQKTPELFEEYDDTMRWLVGVCV